MTAPRYRCPTCKRLLAGPVCPFDQSPAVALATGDTTADALIAGKYRVVAPLGRGGFGEVFHVRHVDTGWDRALKVLHPDATRDPRAVDRFLAEAVILDRLRSPKTVRVYEFGRMEEGTCFLVLELLRGRTLKAELAARGQLTPRRTVDVARQTLASLAEGHDLGIVHRDIKPDNLYLCDTSDGTDDLRVLDFGIAKILAVDHPALAAATGAIGTPLYMSPEQGRGEAVDTRADLYALGCVVFHCLAGTPPFAGSVSQVLLGHQSLPPPPISLLRPEVDAGLARIVMRLLEKDRGQRFASAAAVDSALAAWQVGALAADPEGSQTLAAVIPVSAAAGMGVTAGTGATVGTPGGPGIAAAGPRAGRHGLGSLAVPVSVFLLATLYWFSFRGSTPAPIHAAGVAALPAAIGRTDLPPTPRQPGQPTSASRVEPTDLAPASTPVAAPTVSRPEEQPDRAQPTPRSVDGGGAVDNCRKWPRLSAGWCRRCPEARHLPRGSPVDCACRKATGALEPGSAEGCACFPSDYLCGGR